MNSEEDEPKYQGSQDDELREAWAEADGLRAELALTKEAGESVIMDRDTEIQMLEAENTRLREELDRVRKEYAAQGVRHLEAMQQEPSDEALRAAKKNRGFTPLVDPYTAHDD